MSKLLTIACLAILAISVACTGLPVPNARPKTHKDFIAQNRPMNLGYFDDWGLTYFDPLSKGLTRVHNYDIVYFAFLTLTDKVDIHWGGTGYRNGSIIDGSMNCTDYDPKTKQFDAGFCEQWSNSGCVASEVSCLATMTPKWCGSRRMSPIIAEAQKRNISFGISIGGWSDTKQTPTTKAQALVLANSIVTFVKTLNAACTTPIINAIDFDWEHMSEVPSTRTAMLTAYVITIGEIRKALPDIIISYTTRFNAFSNYYQQGKAFASNSEGVTVKSLFDSLGYSYLDTFTFVNIMAYDVPPEVISPVGWTVAAYEKILNTFDERTGGLWAPNRIFMGIEPGQQAAGGIYPGYGITMCLFDYINKNGYAGISFWSINQFTYRYNTTVDQQPCDFKNEDGFPSGVNKLMPQCKAQDGCGQPYQNSCSCMENVSPFMAQQASMVYQGLTQVTSQMCSAAQWLGCAGDSLHSNTPKTTKTTTSTIWELLQQAFN